MFEIALRYLGDLMLEEILENIESNLYQLVGQIEYGHISEIETYWASLTESVKRLSILGYSFDEYPESLSDVLKPFEEIIEDNLIDLADEMEFFFEGGGSTDSVSIDEIEELQRNLPDFEDKFLNFTQLLRDQNG